MSDYIDDEIAACTRRIAWHVQEIQREQDRIRLWKFNRSLRGAPEAASGTIHYTVRPRTQ